MNSFGKQGSHEWVEAQHSQTEYVATYRLLRSHYTSHVDVSKVYDPSEDTYLLLDALAAEEETAFLKERFLVGDAPLVVEVGTGSGAALAFAYKNAKAILGREDVLCLGTDINAHACRAARQTVRANARVSSSPPPQDGRAVGSADAAGVGGGGFFLGCLNADLTSPLWGRAVDVLIFNPPYVPSECVPRPGDGDGDCRGGGSNENEGRARDMRFQALATDGGKGGMEVTDRLLRQMPEILRHRGVAYILLCARNRPNEVKERVLRELGDAWAVETVRTSGKQGGWERLQIVRIARERHPCPH